MRYGCDGVGRGAGRGGSFRPGRVHCSSSSNNKVTELGVSWGHPHRLFNFQKMQHHCATRLTTITATTIVTDIHRVHRQRPTATSSSPTMTSLFIVDTHQLYVFRRMISDQAQHLVSTVNDVDSLISSMNDLITTENKSILVKRILTLSSYGDSSNTRPLRSINEMYLNHLVNLDFFDQISAKDQAGPLMEETTVGVNSSGDNGKSFLRFTG